jgi:hypothetical protein
MAATLSCSLSLAQEEPPEEPPEEPSEKFEDRVAPVERNGPAEELERLALKLGLSFAPEGSDAPRPEKSDADAFRGAGFRSWLESQLTVADDSIGVPPAALRKFLEEREAVVWRIAGLLETEEAGEAPRCGVAGLPRDFVRVPEAGQYDGDPFWRIPGRSRPSCAPSCPYGRETAEKDAASGKD